MTEHYVAYRGLVAASLAAMHEGYLPEFLPFANDIRVTEGTTMVPPVGMPEETEWVNNLGKKKNTNQVFAVLRHDDSQEASSYGFAGVMGIHNIHWPDGCATTGSLLGSQANLGKGFGTEAKLLLQYHAFRVLGLRMLLSQVKAFNARSLGHLIKCGYRIVGRNTKRHFHDGSYVDCILLEAHREWWEPIWDTYSKERTLPKLTDEQRELIAKETNVLGKY